MKAYLPDILKKANITFNASKNASLIIKPNGVFEVKNGILSYITPSSQSSSRETALITQLQRSTSCRDS
jgi:hypothetical protein